MWISSELGIRGSGTGMGQAFNTKRKIGKDHYVSELLSSSGNQCTDEKI